MHPIEIGDITIAQEGDHLRLTIAEQADSSTWTVAGAQLTAGVLLHWLAAMTGTTVLTAAATALLYAEQHTAELTRTRGAE